MPPLHVFHDPAGEILWTADTLPDHLLNQPGYAALEPPPGFGANPTRYIVQDGQLVLRETISEQQRAEAVAEVNRLRGDARRPCITVLPGQEMIYLDKERQALAYLSDPDPDLAEYPGLAAEVGITGETVYEVAQVVANLAALWRGISAQIEAICLGAIAQIEGATTFSEIDAAVEAARLALPPEGAPP